jgi:NADPH:quinone reductase
VQFARLLGARQVLATVSSAAKGAIASAAGADTVIDYRRDDVTERVREATHGAGIDRIIEVDVAANATIDLDLIRPGGACVVYGSGASQFALPFFPLIVKNVTLHFFIVYNLDDADRQRAVATLTGWLERSAVVHRIAERLPLERIAEAHEQVEQGAAVGNVVLAIP